MPADSRPSDIDNPLLQGEFAVELARTLRAMLASLIVGALLLLVLVLLDTAARPGEVVAVGALLPCFIGLYLATRAGKLEAAIRGLVVLLIVYAIAGTITYGSIRGAATLGFVGATVVGGIFLGTRALVAAVVISALSILALIAAENAGLLPPPNYSLSAIHGTIWFLVLAAIALNLYYARGLVLRALAQMERQGAEQRRAEGELAASQRRFATAFDLSPIAMTISRMSDGVILEVNRAGVRLNGYTREETIGNSTLRIGTWLDPGDRERFVDELARSGRVEGHERQIRTKDGRFIDVRAFAATIEVDGEACVLSAGMDITAEKRMAQEIRALNESLEARVRERTVELEAALEEIESFSYSVSHDLRSPLRAIDGFTQMLAENATERLHEDDRALLARVRSAAKRMAHLIDDLLDLAKVGQTELRREAVDLSALALQVATRLAEAAPDRAVEWDIEEGMVARCDAGLARILLENLLGNAWKFSARATAPCIRFGRRGAAWEVADNGAGFDMRYAERLFEPFVRLHREDEFAGTGIGLAIVKRIVTRHGGRIEGEGVVGAGATFRFTLNSSRGQTANR